MLIASIAEMDFKEQPHQYLSKSQWEEIVSVKESFGNFFTLAVSVVEYYIDQMFRLPMFLNISPFKTYIDHFKL